MIAIWFYITVWLFAWYSYKLIRAVSGEDQYWHIPQTIFLALVYSPMLWLHGWTFIFLAVQFPFLFNTMLNLYRINSGTQITWKHVGKYDWLKFYQIVSLFCAGLIANIVELITG